MLHVTFGGSCGYSAGMANVKLYCGPASENACERCAEGASGGCKRGRTGYLDPSPAARVRRDDDSEIGQVIGVGKFDLCDSAAV